MYSWVRDTLVSSIFSGPWYNDDLPKYNGFIDNHESYLVSIPRLRQVRVPKGKNLNNLTIQLFVCKCQGPGMLQLAKFPLFRCPFG